jgi:hypothetical protein
MSNSNTMLGDMNKILHKNKTFKRWNDVISVNIPMQQTLLPGEKQSYTQISEFENSSCTQS